MKHLIIFLLLLCSIAVIVTSCESRCRSGREKALSMPKDSRLVGIWKIKKFIDNEDNSNYLSLEANGVRKEGPNIKSIFHYNSVWYTLEDYLYDYSCIQYNPKTDRHKYVIKNDTLKILVQYGYGYKYMDYIRVKESQ